MIKKTKADGEWSATVRVYIDEFGDIAESDDARNKTRRLVGKADVKLNKVSGEYWCLQHSCWLAQCKAKH